jgi:hypothetical protein
MAKNLGRKFATMSEDERRRFALENDEGTSEHPAELSFDGPEGGDGAGQQFSSIREEVADQHSRAVRKAARRQNNPEADSE